jgi:hypothetical protein
MSGCAACELEREWRRVAHSPLLQAGGMALVEGLFDPAVAAAMAQEALQGRSSAYLHPDGADTEQVRGGTPARQLLSVDGGPLQQELYARPELAALVGAYVASPVRPCGAQASYSIYRDTGAHLALHRDVRGCDLALITCLHDNNPGAAGGCTEVWLADGLTPLDRLRQGAGGSPTRLALLPGQSMLLHGGVLPHRILPTEPGRMRIVSLMCFEMLDG